MRLTRQVEIERIIGYLKRQNGINVEYRYSQETKKYSISVLVRSKHEDLRKEAIEKCKESLEKKGFTYVMDNLGASAVADENTVDFEFHTKKREVWYKRLTRWQKKVKANDMCLRECSGRHCYYSSYIRRKKFMGD